MTALDRRTLAPFAALAAAVVVLLLLPFPGSLSPWLYRAVASTTAGTPGVDLVSLAALGLLATGVAAAGVHVWRAHRDRLPVTLAAAAGVPLAYGTSEGLKLVLTQERPCTRWAYAAQCPPPGDWSLPSNHATVAFAAVVVLAVAVRAAWVAWSGVGVAAVAAAGRVMEGVHYPHDVAVGAVVGVAVTALVAWATAVVVRRRRGGTPATA
jgi:undecaprenyl-diphosphatase